MMRQPASTTPFTVPALLPVMKIVLVLALLVRSLIPLGFMPGASAKGALVPLVICAGTAVQTVYLPASQLPTAPGDHHPAESHGACIFALNALFHGAAPVASLPVPAPVMAATPALNREPVRAQTPAAAYDPQGPPAFLLHD